ncbi:hypothetical protein PGTDC60_0774 [Porphyromonas gingivalis TDC60]|uniref:NACHT domain-containing protein n=1 Tax=Porphyromonas gingivalis TaxID=837 RepID=UPI00020F0239|nr:NTPase [Porphyromonas gingivalis]AUR47338.1 P-loop containing Nucleoside Triphosphate Hydrolase [Porphyromonas gingivalis]BAK24936.1 hypothetical protein PGTDC60_0774 [Porphyromonas gingivalis TDC60]
MDIDNIDRLFQEYGYDIKESTASYRVYLLNQGMYHGAEIQIMDDNTEETQIFERYSKLGYHAKKQRFRSIEEAESYLFKGFFNTQTTANDINRRYTEFATNQVKHYCGSDIKYQYISMPYSIYKEDAEDAINGTSDIISVIKETINRKGAHLVVVEAAAGFGKTCTAYEIYKSFLDSSEYHKPIFTELSRNRDVKQFKYILWSEIDKEKDTTAKQELVVYNIKKGRIPLIIDGFDELLSKNIDPGKTGQLNEFEQVETMLSTIGDLLTDEAKIILTSRKTAIFAGTEFGDWVDSYNGNFDVIRFQLEKPNIKQWLSTERYEEIIGKNIPLESISNPVLLTYLRNIDQNNFSDLLIYPETITDKYFEYLLNREKERQNLIIRWEDQMQIFENLARSFVEFDITGENRSFVKELIIEYNKSRLLDYKELMPTKQTLEELADTLTNHALLDRAGNKDFISFINEFIFGYLLGKSIQKEPVAFLQKLAPLPNNLIELAVCSYKYSSKKDKLELWNKLSVIKDKMSFYLAVITDCVLIGKIMGTYECKGLNSFHFEDLKIFSEECKFTETSFVDSVFERCTFDVNAFHNVTFTGCKFIDCNMRDNLSSCSHNIHFYGCDDYNNGFISSLKVMPTFDLQKQEDIDLEIEILGKFFKVDGKSPKMKYISALRKEFEGQDLDVVFATFEILKKKGMILIDGNNSHISKSGISYYHKNIQI